MKHSTIVQRLVLLTAIPVTALVLSSGVLIWDSFNRYQSAIQARSIMEAAVAAGDLIHPLQTERGYTAGFVQSKGGKFSDTLPGIRTQTDDKLVAYKRLLSGIDTSSMPGLRKAVEEAQHKLDGLARMREQANQFSIPAAETSAFFTDTIGYLLEVMSTAAEHNSDPAIAKQLLTYHNFSNAKENAGQERALTAPIFVANKVEPVQYSAILCRIYKQEAYLDAFIDSASEQEKTALKTVLSGDAASDVQHMRAVVAERAVQGGFNVDPAVWLKRITDKINGLYDVEQLVTKNIDA
ncbi:MAG: nitrate- and nitrite sensing domain-containing protein, partial [Sideroxydans sp.]